MTNEAEPNRMSYQQTRTGKGIGEAIPAALDRGESVVIIDPKPDLSGLRGLTFNPSPVARPEWTQARPDREDEE